MYDARRPRRASARSSARPDWWSPIFTPRATWRAVLHRGARRPRRAPGRVRAVRPRPVTGPTACPAIDVARDRGAGRRRGRRGRAVDATSSASTSSAPCGRSTGPSTTRCAGASPIPAGSASARCAITCGCASSTSPRRSPPAPTARRTRLVIELVDAFRPANSGRWLDRRWTRRCHVRADQHRGRPHALRTGARCVLPRRRRAVDARRGGAHHASGPSGALRRADRFFVVHPSPWCTTHF